MPSHYIRRLLILGVLAIFGIIFIQSFWVLKTWKLKDHEFDYNVMFALRNVAQALADFNQSELPTRNLIQRKSSNYYAVNFNDNIDASILESYLIREFNKVSLNTNFEYAVYDCFSDNLVYGGFCEISHVPRPKIDITPLGKVKNLDYYFVVRFPSRESFILSNMSQSILFSVIALLAVLFFGYAIFVILRQKKLSELQKDFINNMTHEFKTPISSIKIAVEAMQQNQGIRSDSRMYKYASIIQDQNQRLNDQVGKILNIAKLEQGTLDLVKETLELNYLISGIKEDLETVLTEKEAQIQVNSNKASVHLQGDKLHLTNILFTLIDNGIKYNDKKPIINIDIQENKKDIDLKLTDNGIGISKEHQDRVFEKFYRVSTGNVHNVKGFGLGLYYVKKVIDAHDWEVRINSEINKGTCVHIKIPKN